MPALNSWPTKMTPMKHGKVVRALPETFGGRVSLEFGYKRCHDVEGDAVRLAEKL